MFPLPPALPPQPTYTTAAPPLRATACANFLAFLNALALQPSSMSQAVPLPLSLSVDALALLEDVLFSPSMSVLLVYTRLDERLHQHVHRLRSGACAPVFKVEDRLTTAAAAPAPANTVVPRPGAAPLPMPSMARKSTFPLEQRAVLEQACDSIKIYDKRSMERLMHEVNTCVDQATGAPLKPMTELQIRNWFLNRRKGEPKKKKSKISRTPQKRKNPWSESDEDGDAEEAKDDNDDALSGLKPADVEALTICFASIPQPTDAQMLAMSQQLQLHVDVVKAWYKKRQDHTDDI